MTYETLATRLNDKGWNETKAGITNKLARGAFTATFSCGIGGNRMSRGQVGGFIAAFLLGKYFVRQNTYFSSQRKHQNNCADDKIREIISIPTVDIRTHTEERDYQEGKDKRAWVQRGLLIGALIANCAAALAGVWSATESRRQAIAAENASRPWIQIKKTDIISLDVTENKIEATFKFLIFNAGVAPARNVYIIAELGVPYYSEAWDEERDFCEGLGNGGSSEQHPFILFAQQDTSKEGEVNVDFDKLGFYTKNVPLRVIGCMIYEGTTDTIRHTSFEFRISPEPDRRHIGPVANPRLKDDPYASAYVD